MASKRDLEQLLGKVLLDEQFRQEFLADPQKAADQLGIELKEKELQKAKSVRREDLESLVQAVDQLGATGAYSWGG